ncbi:hypothetical protein Pcinc_006925 [Petrolisthes cinctipes]|uniref:Uncharacterized protein n=1 Tax=Petrolisthes cinctipes TaxID=88211 RepID=A0AAE1G9K5_PETCI|nr:hypothetical protein Pcinc_006925 [Petrolisthes cinctipes]
MVVHMPVRTRKLLFAMCTPATKNLRSTSYSSLHHVSTHLYTPRHVFASCPTLQASTLSIHDLRATPVHAIPGSSPALTLNHLPHVLHAHAPNYYLLYMLRSSMLTHPTTTYSTCYATLRSQIQQLPTLHATVLYAHVPINYLIYVLRSSTLTYQQLPNLRATLLYAHQT